MVKVKLFFQIVLDVLFRGWHQVVTEDVTAFLFVSANTSQSADYLGDADEGVSAFAFACGDSPKLSCFVCGVFLFHAFKIPEMREKSRDFLFFSDDFFLPDARLDAMEFHLVRTFRRPSFEDAEGKRGERANGSGFFCVVEDFAAGVVFLFHA